MDRCEACGFDYYGFLRTEVPGRLHALAAAHAERLSETPAAYLRAQPPEGWTALEYACHVRDVLTNQRARIELAQVEDDPEFVPMGRDELAVSGRYNDQEPTEVGFGLVAAAAALVDELAGLDDTGWARTGLYNYPAPQLRDVDWIARHTIHELSHHLTDVDQVLLAVLEDGTAPFG